MMWQEVDADFEMTRELARRWAVHLRDIDMLCTSCGVRPHRYRPSPEAGPHWRCSECGEVTETHGAHPKPLDDDEALALLGWVRRRMERAAACVEAEWAKLCSQIQGRALGLAKLYEGNGWLIGEGYFTGEEWVYPACRPDREAISDDVGSALGGAFAKGNGTKATALASALCEEAGWPS